VIKLEAKFDHQIRFLERPFWGRREVGGILDTYAAKTPNADVIGDLMIWTLEVNKAKDVSRILLSSFALLAPYSGDLIRLIRWQP
jgi:hypothetical protein